MASVKTSFINNDIRNDDIEIVNGGDGSLAAQIFQLLFCSTQMAICSWEKSFINYLFIY